MDLDSVLRDFETLVNTIPSYGHRCEYMQRWRFLKEAIGELQNAAKKNPRPARRKGSKSGD